MGGARQTLYYLLHPQQLRSIIQWKVWHDPVHLRNPSKETPSETICFKFLDLTSRSFSAVIQELNPELLMPVTLFYLVLRGLDTIEDDMTLDINTKEPLLRHFHEYLDIDGWTFDGCGPHEKDRELLVCFDNVIAELNKIKPEYRAVIRQITGSMGNGMANYALNSEVNECGLMTIADYELYCHYVAGLVGDGLTRLFVASKLANPALQDRPELTESMGQFLQKVNIIRDLKEDMDEGKKWWPKEIWSKHVDHFEDLAKPQHLQQALWCGSEMVLDALKHAEDCLYYMAAVKDQSVFNFVAIPQAMAIATLETVFMNPALFKRNVKISRGDACQLMIESTQNLKVLCQVFRRYARKIHHKADPRDPSYMRICIQCGKIETFIENIFPTQNIAQLTAQDKAKARQREAEQAVDRKEAAILIGAVILVMTFVGALMIGTAWFMGARYDGIAEKRSPGKVLGGLDNPTPVGAPTPVGHQEL